MLDLDDKKINLIKYLLTLAFKLALLSALAALVAIDLTLFAHSLTDKHYSALPFAMAVALVMLVVAVVWLLVKSWAPLIWALLCVVFALVFMVFAHKAVLLIVFCLLVGAISFIHPNNITDSLLHLLPILAGAWLFLQFVYLFFFYVWLYFLAIQKGNDGSALWQSFVDIGFFATNLAMVIPILLLYFLGKHSYLQLKPYCKGLLERTTT